MEIDAFALYQYALDKLDAQTHALQAEYRDHLQCRKGCSGCCMDGFRIRYVEALYLLKGFVQAEPQTAQAILNNLNQSGPQQQGKCPLLIDGACALYNHRPSLCRAYGLMLQLKDNVSTCTLNFTRLPQGQAVKVLDIVPYYVLLDDLSERLWQQAPRPEVAEGDADRPPNRSIRSFFERFLQIRPRLTPAPQAQGEGMASQPETVSSLPG